MSGLNYHHLYLFWRVAQAGQFSKAAASLRISQSAITIQVRALEESLGRVLLDRSDRRRLELTEDGREVFRIADGIFEAGSELLRWADPASRESAGPRRVETIRVGCISGLSRNFQFEFFEPIVSSPELNQSIKIEVMSGDPEKLIPLLQNHAIDVILSSHNVHSYSRDKFQTTVLSRSKFVFALRREYFKKSHTLSDYMAETALVLPGITFEARPEIDAFLARLLKKTKIAPRVFAEIEDIALLRLFAVNSSFVVGVPEVGIRRELESGVVAEVARAEGIEQRYYAITRERRVPSETLSRLIESMRLKKSM